MSALPFDGAFITVMTDADHQEPLCATNEVARRIDELQFALGEGPGLDAHASERAVLVPNLTEPTEHRWPLFAHAVADTLATTLYAIPLHVGRTSIGVFCLYSRTPQHLQTESLVNAIRVADVATWTIIGAATSNEPRHAPWLEWLAAAPRWAEVHQATGFLGSQMDVPVETALARLRAYAFTHDRSLSEVAHDVTHGRLRLDEDNQ